VVDLGMEIDVKVLPIQYRERVDWNDGVNLKHEETIFKTKEPKKSSPV